MAEERFGPEGHLVWISSTCVHRFQHLSRCVWECLISLKLNRQRFLHSVLPCAWCDREPRVSYTQFLRLRENSLMSIELVLCVGLSVGWA